MILDFFYIAIKTLRQRKLRAWLTTVGIVISVMSIVALISISNGLQHTIEKQFESIGSNRIFVFIPGGQPGTRVGLTTKDVETLERMNEFDYVTPYLIEPSAKVTFEKEVEYEKLVAWPAKGAQKRFDDYDMKFSEGRPFLDREDSVVILGHLTATDLFDKDVHASNNLIINDQKFKVVGVLQEIGSQDNDRQLLIPLDAARALLKKRDEVSFIEATVKSGKTIESVVEETKRRLKSDRNNDNVDVLTPAQALNFFRQVLGIVQGILVGIAAISLLVGCVGIMNSMYTSVLERTKEIGVMKSLGATNRSIMILFLIESGIIGLIGGFIGIFLGVGLSFVVSIAARSAGFGLLDVQWDWKLAVGALLFATVVGMIAGALPSRSAAKLHPVDALRWE